MIEGTIAVDIGASSGRLIFSYIKDGTMVLEEVHRFKNNMKLIDQQYVWDVDSLYNEILEGLKMVLSKDYIIKSIGIDTWAVDYVLVDEDGQKVTKVYAYRDHRTDNTMKKVFEVMDTKEIYGRTGIQFLQFNTLYQLFEHVRQDPEVIEKTSKIMMIPDYLNYRLCGVEAIEYTNATSTQLLNVHNRRWDKDLFELIGLDSEKMAKVVEPGTFLGPMNEMLQQSLGCEDIQIIAPATHDTGSAIVSVPALEDDFAYISSGTWSLMGIESEKPLTDDKARVYNFTNEGGVFGTYRVLKNIIGLWLIQEVARLYEGRYSFAEFVEMAEAAPRCGPLINPAEERFLNPENMIEAIQDYCKETDQQVPQTPGVIARCIFESLACLYRMTLEQIREISDKPIHKIHVIGGGCQNQMLNRLCADYTNCEVHAGPVEATAIGNLMMQMITRSEVKDLAQARKIVRESFSIEIYKPMTTEFIEAHYKHFRRLYNNG